MSGGSRLALRPEGLPQSQGVVWRVRGVPGRGQPGCGSEVCKAGPRPQGSAPLGRACQAGWRASASPRRQGLGGREGEWRARPGPAGAEQRATGSLLGSHASQQGQVWP